MKTGFIFFTKKRLYYLVGKEFRLILSDLSDYEIGVKWKMFTPLIVYFTCTKILERVKPAYKTDKKLLKP